MAESENLIQPVMLSKSLYSSSRTSSLSMSEYNLSQSQASDMQEGTKTFDDIIYGFMKKCSKYRKDEIVEKLIKLKEKVGLSYLETQNAKQFHSLAADENFVYITGGAQHDDERSFEILVLKTDSIIKGPDLSKKRHNHSSFIIDNYLYVIGGKELNEAAQTLSFERINIFSYTSKLFVLINFTFTSTNDLVNSNLKF